MSTRSDIIKEALLNADQIHESTVNRAKEELYNVFSQKIENSVRRAINETVSVGKDQPSGYAQEEDQDALAFGSSKHSTAKKDDINKGGKGSQKLEGSINMDEEYDEEDMDETFPNEPGTGEDDSQDDALDVMPMKDEELDELFDEEDDEESMDEVSEEEDMDEASEEEELDEVSDDEDLDEKKEEEDVDEEVIKTKQSLTDLKETNKQLQKENREYKKAFSVLKNKFSEVNLLNAKLGGAMRFLRNPNLTIKQKESIVETFDRAKNVGEVKLIVRTLTESYKHSSLRKPTVERPVRPSSSRRLDESFNANSKRLQELAGIDN